MANLPSDVMDHIAALLEAAPVASRNDGDRLLRLSASKGNKTERCFLLVPRTAPIATEHGPSCSEREFWLELQVSYMDNPEAYDRIVNDAVVIADLLWTLSTQIAIIRMVKLRLDNEVAPDGPELLVSRFLMLITYDMELSVSLPGGSAFSSAFSSAFGI